MSEFVLYNAPQSTCSQRVRYALHVKGQSFEEHKLDLFKGDQLSRNIWRSIPTASCPPWSMTARRSSIPPSFSISGGCVRRIIADAVKGAGRGGAHASDDALYRRGADASRARSLLQSRLSSALPGDTEEEFLAVCESKPLRREFLMKLGRTGFPQSEMDEAIGRLRRGVDRMAQWLRDNGGPWLMGESLFLVTSPSCR